MSRSLWVRVLVLEARLRHDIKWLLLATTAAAATPVLHRLLGQRRGIVLFGRHIVRQEQRPRLAGIETKLKHTLFVVAAVRWVRYQNLKEEGGKKKRNYSSLGGGGDRGGSDGGGSGSGQVCMANVR